MRNESIRPNNTPMINGGEIESIIGSWKIRVRPFVVDYPNGKVRSNNKSTVLEVGKYSVDVMGAYRWVVVYLNVETLDIKTYGGIQEFNIENTKPIDIKKHKEFNNKNIVVLGDLKFMYGNTYANVENIDYTRRGAFMMSSSSYISEGTDISDHLQALNDGSIVSGYSGIASVGGIEIGRTTSGSTLRGTILEFRTNAVIFVDNPQWEIGVSFSVSGAQTPSNDGHYEIVGTIDDVYFVKRRDITGVVPIVVDNNQGGIATLSGVKTMNTEYINTDGTNYIKLNKKDSNTICPVVQDIPRNIGTENMMYYEEGAIRGILISNSKHSTLPMRCQTTDIAENSCGIPDTAGGDWSAFELNAGCSIFCEELCQTACEELCQSNCESSCECGREQSSEEICQSIDYSNSEPHSLWHKCDATIETDNETGATCHSCDASCDITTACHVPSPPCGDCDSCDAAIENACLSCDNSCEDHTRHYHNPGPGRNSGSCDVPVSVSILNGDTVEKKMKASIDRLSFDNKAFALKFSSEIIQTKIVIGSLNIESSSGEMYAILEASRDYTKDGKTIKAIVEYKYKIDYPSMGTGSVALHSKSSIVDLGIIYTAGYKTGASRSEWEPIGAATSGRSRKQWVQVKENNLNGWVSSGSWSWRISGMSNVDKTYEFEGINDGFSDYSYFKFEVVVRGDGSVVQDTKMPITLKVANNSYANFSIVGENTNVSGNVMEKKFTDANSFKDAKNRTFIARGKVIYDLVVAADGNYTATINRKVGISVRAWTGDNCNSRDKVVSLNLGSITGKLVKQYYCPNAETCMMKENHLTPCYGAETSECFDYEDTGGYNCYSGETSKKCYYSDSNNGYGESEGNNDTDDGTIIKESTKDPVLAIIPFPHKGWRYNPPQKFYRMANGNFDCSYRVQVIIEESNGWVRENGLWVWDVTHDSKQRKVGGPGWWEAKDSDQLRQAIAYHAYGNKGKPPYTVKFLVKSYFVHSTTKERKLIKSDWKSWTVKCSDLMPARTYHNARCGSYDMDCDKR